MLKQDDPKGKKLSIGHSTMLNLAEELAALLLVGTSEYCTPGHRMGHSYDLLITGLTRGHHPIGTRPSGMESAITLSQALS